MTIPDDELTASLPAKASVDSIKLIPYPKIIFMYPSVLFALVAAIWLTLIGEPKAVMQDQHANMQQGSAAFLTLIFVWIFGLNSLVLAFDFPRSSSLTIVIAVIAAIFGLVMLSHWKPGLLGGVTNWLASLKPVANATFYWMFVTVGLLLLLAVKVVVKFDYWEVRSHELLHHFGLWGNLNRYSAPHVRIDKEVNDVFEFMLFGSGRLILQPSGEQRAFVLDNIIWINRKEEEITKLLGALKVDVRDD